MGKEQEIYKNPWKQQIHVEIKVFSLDYIVGSLQFLRAGPWKQGESKCTAFVLHRRYIKKKVHFIKSFQKLASSALILAFVCPGLNPVN